MQLGGVWGVLGVGERLLGSGFGKWLWCKELGGGKKVNFWAGVYYWIP